jgi:hypothetical protein
MTSAQARSDFLVCGLRDVKVISLITGLRKTPVSPHGLLMQVCGCFPGLGKIKETLAFMVEHRKQYDTGFWVAQNLVSGPAQVFQSAVTDVIG